MAGPQILGSRPPIRLEGIRLPPVTGFVLVCTVVSFLGEFFAQRSLFALLDFDPAAVLARPWAFLTYPLHGAGVVSVLLLGYVFWLVGGSLERDWGSTEFGLFFAAVAAAHALAAVAAGQFTGVALPLVGLSLPLSATFVAWCMVNPGATVLVMLVIPVPARVLGYIVLAITYFASGPVLGLFAVLTPLAAWWYAARGRRFLPVPTGREASFAAPAPKRLKRSLLERWNPFAWYARRKRRREFERRTREAGLNRPGAGD